MRRSKGTHIYSCILAPPCWLSASKKLMLSGTHSPRLSQSPKFYWQRWFIIILFFCTSTQKQLVSIIEGLCKGHGCLNRTEIITRTAILKSANVFKGTSSTTEQHKGISLSQGDDFFQRLQTAFTETGEGHPSFNKDKTRYIYMWNCPSPSCTWRNLRRN